MSGSPDRFPAESETCPIEFNSHSCQLASAFFPNTNLPTGAHNRPPNAIAPAASPPTATAIIGPAR
jgi:hypothetical protein